VILHEADFPDYFINKNHPDDFKPSREPIKELIFHKLQDHNRLILRISVKIRQGIYIPFTFVCDTGAPSHIYLNDITKRLIQNRIFYDDSDNQVMTINGRNYSVKKSPELHKDTNIIGLLALIRFKMYFTDNGFDFENLPDFF